METTTKTKKGFLYKFIGDKAFYKMVLAIAVPIMVQNGITNFVSLLDNIMIGQIGTEPMSGVAIVNQLIFVYNLCLFGGVSGAGIFTAQYFGQKKQLVVKLFLAGNRIDREITDIKLCTVCCQTCMDSR